MHQYTTDVNVRRRGGDDRAVMFGLLLVGFSAASLALGIMIGYGLHGFGA